MKYYRMRAELKSPLLIQESREANAARGLSYMPGASLRGAIAGHYLRRGGNPEDAPFRSIFLESPVLFPDLLPANGPKQSVRPFPMTACSCKRVPGFLEQKGHGAGDTLAALIAAELEQRPLVETFDCQTCNQEMKPWEGFWNGDPLHPEKLDTARIYERHTGIDRHTGTVASSIFYITQGMAETRKLKNGQYSKQLLSGGLYLSEDQLAFLLEWLSDPLFVGADRTRGMGEICIALEEDCAPVFDLEGWSQAFRQKVAGLSPKPLPEGLYFSIGLDSPAILVDRFLRPDSEIDLGFPDVEPVFRMVRSHMVKGWQSSWNLPKAEDAAVSRGSVYLFRFAGKDSSRLESGLKQLMIEGIGLRRPEGFGRVQICDPFHVQEVI